MSADVIIESWAAGPVFGLALEAHGVIDRMLAVFVDGSVDRDIRALVRELERLLRRVDAVRLRALDVAQQRSVAGREGFTSTTSWAAGATAGNPARLARDVEVGSRLGARGLAAAGAPGAAAVADHPAADLAGGAVLGDHPGGDRAGVGDGAEVIPLHLDGGGAAGGGDAGGVASGGSASGVGLVGSQRGLTSWALDEGRLSVDHAAVILNALDGLPDTLTVGRWPGARRGWWSWHGCPPRRVCGGWLGGRWPRCAQIGCGWMSMRTRW